MGFELNLPGHRPGLGVGFLLGWQAIEDCNRAIGLDENFAFAYGHSNQAGRAASARACRWRLRSRVDRRPACPTCNIL